MRATSVILVALACLWETQKAKGADPDYDRSPLIELTQYRAQYRFANGILCAGAFVQDSQTYTDCTDAPNPDGIAGREWCWFETQELGVHPKNWGYCDEVVNYNLLRPMANSMFLAKVIDSEKIMESLDAERKRLEDMETRYESICKKGTDKITAYLQSLGTVLEKSKHCVSKIEAANLEIKQLQYSIMSAQEELDVRRNQKYKSPYNCEGIRGYEDDPSADGLKGFYYDNPYLLGKPLQRIDEEINFIWAEKPPIENLNNDEFSVRWKGYIEAPYTTYYAFALESDCGARLFLNGKCVIADRMPNCTESQDIDDNDNSVPITVYTSTGVDGLMVTQSLPILMEAGDRHKISIEMIHSSHLKWKNPDVAEIKFLVRYHDLPFHVVPKEMLFVSNYRPSLKISGLNPDLFDTTYLYDGECAFKDNKENVIGDVPLHLYGSKVIRPVQAIGENDVAFEINVPASVYMAAPVNVSLPFNLGSIHASLIVDTEEILSIYTTTSKDSAARNSMYLRIYKADIMTPGNVSVHIDNKNIPWVLFLFPLVQESSFCGGRVSLLSDPNSPVFETCSESSVSSQMYTCRNGLNGNGMDQPYGTWKTKSGSGVGEFIVIRFNRKVKPMELKFKPLDFPTMWPSEITVNYSESNIDDMRETLEIVYASNMNNLVYELKPVVTKYMKIEISKMNFANMGTGGSFEIRGTECEEEATDTTSIPPQTFREPPASFVKVSDCFTTINELQGLHPMEEGKKVHISCSVNCADQKPGNLELEEKFLHESEYKMKTRNTAPSQNETDFLNHLTGSAGNDNTPKNQQESPIRYVFGTDNYAPESSVCKTAVHSGVCFTKNSSKSESDCSFVVQLIKGKLSFKGSTMNDVTSVDHGPSEIAAVFTRTELFQPVKNKDSNLIAGSSYDKFSAHIWFGSLEKNFPPLTSLIDDGSVFNKEKESLSNAFYGWSRTAKPTECQYFGDRNYLNQGGIEFPHGVTYAGCKSEADPDCGPSSWTIYVPRNSLYQLDVQVGNPCQPPKGTRNYYIQANGKSLLSGKKLAAGKFFWIHELIQVTNGTITLTADCSSSPETPEGEDCSKSITTIMNVNVAEVENSTPTTTT